MINCAAGGGGYAGDEKDMLSSIYEGHGQSGRALFWSVDARRRDYAFTDYFHAEQQYRKPGSKIVSKSISVFEAAPAKMDATYARAKDARNAYFQHFHVQLLIAALLLAAAEFLLYFVLEAVDTAMFVFLMYGG